MPWGICVDELGDVYVADWRNDRVQKFTADGEFIFSIGRSGDGEGEFNRPSGVTVDDHGDIYVADWANNRVQLFRPDGVFVELFRGDATLSKQALHYMRSNIKALRLREMASIEPQKRIRWPGVRPRLRPHDVHSRLRFGPHPDIQEGSLSTRPGRNHRGAEVSDALHSVLKCLISKPSGDRRLTTDN